MWYVGIDLHKRHLTICVRDEQGDMVRRRQVSTRWAEVDPFLESLSQRSQLAGGVRGGDRGLRVSRLAGGAAGPHDHHPVEDPKGPRSPLDRGEGTTKVWLGCSRRADRLRADRVVPAL